MQEVVRIPHARFPAEGLVLSKRFLLKIMDIRQCG